LNLKFCRLLAIEGALIAGLLSPEITAKTIADTLKTAFAKRAVSEIHIDGYLNEQEWETAPAIYGFRQIEPNEGEPASESTLVKILYDDAGLVFGFWCYDREPDKIIRQLTRRDRWTVSDKVAVRIDSHHDHRTAYFFGVNVSGVLTDILLYDNYKDDDSWDAVWSANAKMTAWGWSAEIRVPYSALRFAKSEEYLWGINFSRFIARKMEDARWQFVPSDETGGVSRYGHLAGIKNIEPPGRLETLPYLVSYGVTEPKSLGNVDGRDYISNVGADIKYGVSSALTLDAAINPDFGQVESDEAAVNLGVYEIQYEEKRPFFLEGAELFNSPFFDQFYSRRIGRAPHGQIDSARFYINYPRNTTILSALKLTGKTESGASIGILSAATQEEKTRYKVDTLDDSPEYEGVVEPAANYTAARIKQDVFGDSYIGGMFTSANQKDRNDAYTGSADCQIYFLKQKYAFSGMIIGSNNGPGTGGYGFGANIQKSGGKLTRGEFNVYYLDKKIDLNRLGYLDRNALQGQSAWIQFRSDKRFWGIHYLRLNLNGWYNRNLDGYRLDQGGNVNGGVGFENNWQLNCGWGTSWKAYDDLETRGNGLWETPPGYEIWISGHTNESKSAYAEFNYTHTKSRGGRSNFYGVWTSFRPMANFELSAGNEFSFQRDKDFWVGSGEDDSAVFGKLNLDEWDLTFRCTYTFTRDLTIQSYSQFYFTAGDFNEFKKLVSPSQFALVDTLTYTVDFARNDFNYKSLNLNLILRWEYRPGSTLYLVWTHARGENIDGLGDFRFPRDFGDLFATPQTNTFLIKANYWWNI
jgi:hypothetical protein